MKRKDFLPKKTKEDEKLIELFKNSTERINQLFLQAVKQKSRVKSKIYLQKILSIKNFLKKEYGLRLETRTYEEYLKGVSYIDYEIHGDNTLFEKIERKNNKLTFHKKTIKTLPIFHLEAVKSLIGDNKSLVYSSLDGIERSVKMSLSKVNQIKVQEKIAEGMIIGQGTKTTKKDVIKILNNLKNDRIKYFESQGVSGFKDKAGRFWNTNRYAEMLVRTETARANTQGTLNRGIENGYTKYEVVEKDTCCSLCAGHNGKVVDISKGTVELPPFHPNCCGFVNLYFDEKKLPFSKFGTNIDNKVNRLAKKYGVEGKNILEKMKKLNKIIKKKGVTQEQKKEVYKVKHQMIIDEARKKGKIIKDRGRDTTLKIKQGKVKVDWHLSKSVKRELKREKLFK